MNGNNSQESFAKLEGIKTTGIARSSKWEEVRKEWLKNNPVCFACGTDKDLQVHHVVPFHTDIGRELDPTNFMTLCEGMERNCHRFIGHLDNFQSINVNVRKDAEDWRYKIINRPKWDGKNWVTKINER